jgi:hypothetical protein
MPKKSYTLCDFAECLLKEKCARYLEGLNRLTTNHFAFMPYNPILKKCGFFEPFTEEGEKELSDREINELIQKWIDDAEEGNKASV